MRYYPQLAGKGDESILGSTRYQYEPKLDGIRCLVYVNSAYNNDGVKLMSRTGKDMTKAFPEIVRAFGDTTGFSDHVLDGEIVVVRADGREDYQALQTRTMRQANVQEMAEKYPATFVAFDVLVHNGLPCVYLQLQERRKILEKYVTWPFRIIDTIAPQDVHDYYENLDGREGVMAKLLTSPYRDAQRSKEWLKLKPLKETTLFIGGCTWGIGKRANTFAALLLGSMPLDKLGMIYQGSVGTGFTDQQLKDIMILLTDRKCTDSPFFGYPTTHPQADQVRLYCEPNLKARVSYQETTNDGKLRFPTFKELIVD